MSSARSVADSSTFAPRYAGCQPVKLVLITAQEVKAGGPVAPLEPRSALARRSRRAPCALRSGCPATRGRIGSWILRCPARFELLSVFKGGWRLEPSMPTSGGHAPPINQPALVPVGPRRYQLRPLRRFSLGSTRMGYPGVLGQGRSPSRMSLGNIKPQFGTCMRSPVRYRCSHR